MTDYARGIEQATCELENAKLRELIRDIWGNCYPDKSCEDCEIRGECHTEIEDAMDSMMYGLHYKGVLAYWWGCAFKYLWRWPYKGVREDLEKAKACIDYLIESLPGGDDS